MTTITLQVPDSIGEYEKTLLGLSHPNYMSLVNYLLDKPLRWQV